MRIDKETSKIAVKYWLMAMLGVMFLIIHDQAQLREGHEVVEFIAGLLGIYTLLRAGGGLERALMRKKVAELEVSDE